MSMNKAENIHNSYLDGTYAEFWIEGGIVMEIFKPQVKKITLEIAQSLVEDRLKVSAGVTRPLFVDLHNFTGIEPAAQKHFGGEASNSYVSASAFLLHSYIHLVIARFFLTIYKPKTNIQVFRSKTKALEWLKGFVEEKG